MTDANAQPRPPDEEVVRARRIEVLDDSDRVRVEIGQLEFPGTHDISGFGITLRRPNGSVRAELMEEASGVRLAFVSSGNLALELGAEDAETLMLDRGGENLVYLPVGSPGNEVTESGPYLTLHAPEGEKVVGWRVDPDGSVEVLGPDEDAPGDEPEAGEQSPDTSSEAGMSTNGGAL